MLSKELKLKILSENNIDIVLRILQENIIEELDKDIIKHMQDITPEDTTPISDFSYSRKTK